MKIKSEMRPDCICFLLFKGILIYQQFEIKVAEMKIESQMCPDCICFLLFQGTFTYKQFEIKGAEMKIDMGNVS